MNQKFLLTAKRLEPTLSLKTVVVDLHDRKLEQGEPFIIDFGNHYTGYFSLKLCYKGQPLDAPVLLRIKFAESREEANENTDDYHGWVSKSWIQEEWVHVDSLPVNLKLKRRYAFRFVSVTLSAASGRLDLRLREARVIASTSATKDVKPVGKDERERAIDRIALRTLSECMQKEFEDGPKRDRRLWLGDLRLQALTNYWTFQNNDLVKRCLYLFAGTANKKGKVEACVFTNPKIYVDGTYLYDYSLFFVSALKDYYQYTHDLTTVKELLPTAKRQIELAKEQFSGDVIVDSDVLGWCFLDWNLALNKQCGAQAIYLYALRDLIELLSVVKEDPSQYQEDLVAKTKAAKKAFYDENKGLFVSGEGRQVSYASNVWMILAGVVSPEEAKAILERLEMEKAEKIVTPYMYHHYIEALIVAGKKEQARKVLDDYWGGMADAGADTFNELYNPENPLESPYGGKAVLSYCHAWSCTPSYLYRKYFAEE